jgi:hypothetical protein
VLGERVELPAAQTVERKVVVVAGRAPFEEGGTGEVRDGLLYVDIE